MKSSIFKKVALWLLIIITAVEAVMLIALYNYTYNTIVNEATVNVTSAARAAADHIYYVNPDKFAVGSDDEKDVVIIFTNTCIQYDVDTVYLILPDSKDNSAKYLARGISAHQAERQESELSNDLTGQYVEGGISDEMKRAFAGDDSGITTHIRNGDEDKLVCYMPVLYYENPDSESPETEIKSLVRAEISIKNLTGDFNKKFREFAVIMFIATLTVSISAAVILYFRVSKPLKKISKRMKGFVSDQDREFEKLPVKGNDELAEMSDSFNTMAEELEQYIDDVAELNRQKAELNIAQNIQMGLLEPPSFQNDTVTIEASMTTAKDVGGDLYYYNILENGNVFVAVGDVSGKGITAALFMSRAITLLNQYAQLGYSPSKALFEFNNNLVGHNPNMMFITAFIAVYDPKTGELTYSNAGHNYPYILSDKLTALNTESGIIAGSFSDIEFPEYTVKMKAGDRLFLYTDGITEAENKEGKLFDDGRLEKVLSDHIRSDAKGVLNAVTEEINSFTHGAEQSDDMTMLVLQTAH